VSSAISALFRASSVVYLLCEGYQLFQLGTCPISQIDLPLDRRMDALKVQVAQLRGVEHTLDLAAEPHDPVIEGTLSLVLVLRSSE